MLQKNDQPSGPPSSDETRADPVSAEESTPANTLAGALLRGVAQIALMALVLAIAFAGTMRLVNTRPEVPKPPVFPAVYTVEMQSVTPGDYQPNILLYGEVVAARTVDLRALVSGEIIAINDKLKSGDNVRQGEVLLEIDPFNYSGALREAKANSAETKARVDEAEARLRLERARLVSAREQLILAENDLTRIGELRSRGTATEKQVEDRELLVSQRKQSVEQSEINIVAEQAKIAQLQAAADRLEWKIEQSERDLESTRLVAPFDATISSSSAEIGKLANVNDALVSMYQAESLEARFVLTDEQYGRLQADIGGIAGRAAEVIWNVGGIDYRFPAAIDRIGAEIASARGGVEVFATIDNANNAISLRPGAFVEIVVPDRKFISHMRISDSSVYANNIVYVVQNGELVARKIKIAAYDGDNVIISQGLQSGEEVLVTRISEISEGLKVRQEGDPDNRDGDVSGQSAGNTDDGEG